MNTLLARLHLRIWSHLDAIAGLFNRPMKLSILVRDPTDPETEVFLSDDEFAEIRAALARAESRRAMTPK
jgi:hypothetical protein